jgi:hypothetical protein
MIAGAGFAMMCWAEAKRRAVRKRPHEWTYPLPRGLGHPDGASAEFYRITDDAWHCWNSLTDYARRNWEPRTFL